MNEACFYRISIKGIAFDETGRFLLAREDNGKWEMLGGGLDHNEDPKVGLQREIKEETGLTVTHISKSPAYFVTAPKADKDFYVANVIYVVQLANLDFIPSEECQELRFFSVEEAGKEDLFPNVAKFLEVYNPQLHIQ